MLCFVNSSRKADDAVYLCYKMQGNRIMEKEYIEHDRLTASLIITMRKQLR